MAQSTDKYQKALADKGLPSDPDAERYLLAAVQIDGTLFEEVSAKVEVSDFSTETNRRLFLRMADIYARSVMIGRVTLADELRRHNQLESIGGLTALMDLEEGMPSGLDVSGYVSVVIEKSKLRRLIMEAQRVIDGAMLGHTDASELAAQSSAHLQEISERGRREEQQAGRTPTEIIESYPGGITAFLDPSQRKKGLPTGFRVLDDTIGGLFPSDLIILAARPAVGKSAWALNVMAHLTLDDRLKKMAAFFSMEMASEQLITRMMCARARVDGGKFRAGFLGREERYSLQSALNDIVESRMHLNDTGGMTSHDICRELRKLVKEEGCHIAFVDHLGLIASKGLSESRNLQIGEITRQFKLLAKELHIPIVLLCQLSRANEKRPGDRRPILSDLRESGHIEEDADVVMFLHRPEIYKPSDETLRGVAEVIISKNRHGEIKTVPLNFLKQFTLFTNRADDREEEPPQ